MTEPIDDNVLLDLWRTGDQDAARHLFDAYVDRLVALARRRISLRLTSRIDPEDVVQSVFRTFFQHAREGRFRVEEQESLYRLLVRITVHKTLRKIAFHTAARRNPDKESGGPECQTQLQALLDREPTPEEAVAFLDQLECFFSQLRPQERQILEMRLQGYGTEEIAEKLGTYDRKIRRILERVRGLAEQEGLSPD
jgi:RNA polymerase sigma-70 factor (ECF subfamily)